MRWGMLILGSYLLGAVSFSYLMVRVLRGKDIRRLGSGNAGATNVLRTTGTAPAVLVLLLDVGKGMAAVGLARAMDAPGPVAGAAALAAVLGHVFPVYHGFRGGKGVATAAGAMGTLTPVPALAGLGIFLLVVLLTRYVSIGSMIAVASYPFLIYLCGALSWTQKPPPWLIFTAILLSTLIVGKHYDNVLSLKSGKEWKLGDPPD